MIIYVDIDGTICTITDGQYSDAVPLPSRIEKINKLYDEGNKIVYWTARGSQTGIDWREITKKQLNEWGAKHHELSLNKPHYDLYVDDKTIYSYDYFKD